MGLGGGHLGYVQSEHAPAAGLQRMGDACAIASGLVLACGRHSIPWHWFATIAALSAIALFGYFAELRRLYPFLRAETPWTDLWRGATTWIAVSAGMTVATLASSAPVTTLTGVAVEWFVATGILVCGWRLVFYFVLRQIRRRRPRRRAAIFGASPLAEELAQTIASEPALHIEVAGIYDDRLEPQRRHEFKDRSVSWVGDADKLVNDVRTGVVQVVYITLPLRAQERIVRLADALAESAAPVYLVPDHASAGFLRASWTRVGALSTISINETPLAGPAAWLKRAQDLVLGSVILLLIAIPMVVIALLIKLTSPGPVFFRQRRYGLNGREIRLLKFRTMRVVEDDVRVRHALHGDSRVTRLGSFLRRTSLDELPQFLQVLSGEMSIVGPRPHAIAHNEQYRTILRGHMLRYRAKPGITGWAQVNGWRGETDTVEKMAGRLRHDLEYVANWRLSFDLKIIFLTLFGSRRRSSSY